MALHDDVEWVDNNAPTRRWPALRFTELWQHRELVWFFALRDVKVRYKQAFLGAAWALIQPLIGAATFTLLFHELAGVDVGGTSYFAFALVGYAVWTYVSSSISAGSGSLLYNSDLLTKVSFPRIVAPASSLLPGLIDLGLSMLIAVVVGLLAGDMLSPVGLAVGLIPGLALMVVAVAGPVLYLSAAVVRYRDVTTLVGFGLQVGMFAAPIAYPVDLVPGVWQTLIYLNPVTGVVGLLRSALIGAPLPPAGGVAMSSAVAVIVLIAGASHFRRREREFADII
ncbi:MAG TPA: ABC transporter permease [Ilumatobacter sp.]|nr:ABC transporter permease [Ilumatobacter sp.]